MAPEYWILNLRAIPRLSPPRCALLNTIDRPLHDAVVLDVMLPRLDGWEVLHRLRKQKKTPVLMLTARDAPRDRVRGLDSGADDYLIKPFDLPELLARLRALIRRAAGQTRNLVEIGDVTIDTAARTVSRGGSEVTLTAREYTLVEFLALHRGEV